MSKQTRSRKRQRRWNLEANLQKKQRENVKAEIIEEEKVKREALGEEKGSNRVGKEAKA